LKIVGLPFYITCINHTIYTQTKIYKMKNSFKLAFLALAIATSFAACKGNGSASSDTTTVKTDSTAKTDTTVKLDTTAKKDTTTKK
jgi:hypothetical protein